MTHIHGEMGYAPSRGDETRAALMRAGESLFARQGLDGPSMREITLAAGVKNKSALQYHFGSREGLIVAILEEKGEVMRARRGRAYERLVLDDATSDPRRLADVLIRPYAEFLDDGPSHWAYLCVAAAVLDDPNRAYEEVQTVINDPLIPKIVELLLEQLDVPEELLVERAVTAVSQVGAAIATQARRRLRQSSVRPPVPTSVFIPNLVDMFVGALSAPVSRDTLDALRAGQLAHAKGRPLRA